MSIYKIADLCVELSCSSKRTLQQAEKYWLEGEFPVDVSVACDEAEIAALQDRQPHLGYESCEYILTGSRFYHQLLDHNGVLLHSSAIAVDGRAYLFSAPCSTGKSTHTSLWAKEFGSRAVMINDDKPAIRMSDGVFYAYGTPWSGKTDLNCDVKVPLQAITFIEQSPDNWIRKLTVREALPLFFEQTIRPQQMEMMDKLLSVLDLLLQRVPVYRMGCTISREAVLMAYNTMSKTDGEVVHHEN